MKEKLRRFFICLRYDISQGIFSMYPLYLLELLFVFIFAKQAWDMESNWIEAPSALELGIYVFRGMEEYTYILHGEPFHLPANYLFFTCISALFAAYYPNREWCSRGNMYVLRYQKKIIWWYSKVVLCVMQMICFYGIAFLEMWIYAGSHGNWGFQVRKLAGGALEHELLQTAPESVFTVIFVTGCLTSIMLNQLLTTLQMVFRPVVAYLSIPVIMVISAYYYQPWLPGNNYMAYRSILFREDGIAFPSAVWKLLIFWLLFLFSGQIIIKRKELF